MEYLSKIRPCPLLQGNGGGVGVAISSTLLTPNKWENIVFTCDTKLKTSINEEELLKISSRTKAALQAKKARVVTLGSPQNLTDASRNRSIAVRNENAMHNQNHKMVGYIAMCRDKGGMTFQKIADRLNNENHKTTNGKKFYASTVLWLYEKSKKDRDKTTIPSP
jgi:DNA invertase Pin-like site-specific DNA recombinase